MLRIQTQHLPDDTVALFNKRLRGAKLDAEIVDCDAVAIGADVDDRDVLCRDAVATGKHILMEMPIAPSSADAAALVETCRKAGVHLIAGNAKRWLPSVRKIQDVLASGKLGEPGLLRIHRWDADATQATMIDRLVGEIDLAVLLFGNMPSDVYAVGRSDCRDYIQVHLGFPGGGMALIDAAILPAKTTYYTLSLIGSTGAAYSDDHHNSQLLFGDGNPTALTTAEGNLHLLSQMQEFADAINKDIAPATSLDDALAALKIAETAVESLDNRRVAHRKGDLYEFV